jgi:hypothetical protein
MNRTELNRKALIINKATFQAKGIERCESCNSTYGLTIAHRKKRRHYRTVEELSDINEVLLLCLPCHQAIEVSPDLTKNLFDLKRPHGK